MVALKSMRCDTKWFTHGDSCSNNDVKPNQHWGLKPTHIQTFICYDENGIK
jgi:hypothetical protein